MRSLSPLPIDALISQIAATVRDRASVVLTATPGAGKTTRLPPALLQSVVGKIAILQPRRMAAVAACNRVCEEQGWRVGEEAGFQVRFESKTTRSTRLLFMTDALLLRRMVDDPELKEFSLIVIDEFHERNLNQDLILGCVRELQELGSPLKLLVMSATLDTQRLSAFLPDSVHIDVPGKVYPLDLRFGLHPLRLQTDRTFYERVIQATLNATRETRGDVLVFLPGTGEIARVSEQLLQASVGRSVVALHGSLPLSEQSEVLRAPSSPRVILSTNVAEASVTVQGVDYVIDCGLAKVMETNLSSGFSSLELTRIAQFNARQRAGRAAREKAGVCLRLWTPHEEVTQAEQMSPECMRVDLSSALLQLAQLGVSDFSQFAWFDRPPMRLLEMGVRILKSVGALDERGRLSEAGRRLMRYPLPPRLGHTLAQADLHGQGRLGAGGSAILNERDFVERAATTQHECDVSYRLGMLQEVAQSGRTSGAHAGSARPVLEGARQLEGLVDHPGHLTEPFDDDVRRLLLLSQTDRLCRRRGTSERGVMVGGRGVRLSPDTQVRESGFFLSLKGIDLPGQSETTVSLACGMSKEFLLSVLGDRVQLREDIEFIEEKGRFFARRQRTILDLPIEEPVLSPVDPALVADRLAEILADKWDWLAKQNERLGFWMARWRCLIRLAPEFAQHLGREQVLRTVEMAAFGKTSVAAVVAENLADFVEGVLPADVVRTFREEVPEKFRAPTGHEHRIQYEEHGVYVEIRLQELFGLLKTPRLVFGRAPLTFRLLSPAFRPVQVTADLEGFWRGAYNEVRKELRTRYPKHSWPEDPFGAKPEAKGRRRF